MSIVEHRSAQISCGLEYGGAAGAGLPASAPRVS